MFFDSDEMQKLSIDNISGGINAKRRRGRHGCIDHRPWTMEFFRDAKLG